MKDNLPDTLLQFIQQVEWTWAKTYADTWPHHYIVKDKVDLGEHAQDEHAGLFHKFVLHIREYGEWELFYNTPLKYFEQDGFVYWTMVPPKNNSTQDVHQVNPKWYPPEQETIINKCPVTSTFKERKKQGNLPE